MRRPILTANYQHSPLIPRPALSSLSYFLPASQTSSQLSTTSLTWTQSHKQLTVSPGWGFERTPVTVHQQRRLSHTASKFKAVVGGVRSFVDDDGQGGDRRVSCPDFYTQRFS